MSLRDIFLVLAQGGITLLCALLMAAALMRSIRGGLWQTFGLAMPVLAASVGVYLAGGIESAITLLMAASVCAMLFCNGSCIFLSSPLKEGELAPAGATAALVFPIGIVLLLSGFATQSTSAGLVGLAIIGILALDLTRDASPELAERPAQSGSRLVITLLVAVVPAILLGFSALSLLGAAKTALPLIHPDAFVIVLICPAVTLPLLIRSMREAMTNLGAATQLNSSVTCLLLGIALPAFVVVDYVIAMRQNDYARMAGLPPISWRLDSTLLIMSGFAMLGMRVRLLSPQRWVALLLMLVYGLYILTGTLLRIG